MKRLAARNRQSTRFARGAVLLALLAGCVPPGKPDPADRPVLPDQVLDFHELYAANCAGCHGAEGELGPAPPLNDPLFLAIVPEDALRRVIGDGRVGTPMPAFAPQHGGSLTDEQTEAIARGLKQNWLAADFVAEPAPPPYEPTRPGGVQSSPGNRQRGEQVFARACAGCHGANGQGGGEEHALGGAINAPAFLALVSDQALRRIIITGRADLGMPNFAEKDGRPDDFQPLTSAEIDDLVALLADWRAAGAIAAAAMDDE